ncbi:MAG: hypothetical protein MK116_06070 [Phycisphaerales bacterium]|nr:hypothetical protein [Phycisphaerales bacterium]
MHVLAIIDEARRQEEGPALRDTLSGLQQADVMVTELLPTPPSPESDQAGLVTERPLTAAMPVGWLQRARVRDGLLRDLGRQPPDVVLAFGESTATLASDLAQAMDAPLVVECWNATHVKRPPVRPQRVAAYVTASAGLATALRDRKLHELIVALPFPIALPPQSVDAEDATPSIAILDAAAAPMEAKALIDGLVQVVQDIPDLQICLELGRIGGDPTWQYAESRGLLDRISSISNASTLSPLVSDCTLALMARSTCQARSVLDLAMARGRVIVRPDHPLLSEAERTAQCILMEPTAEQWARTILDLLADGDRRMQIGSAARAQVQHRNDPDRVRETWIQLLDEIEQDVTYPFATAGSRSEST